MEQLILIAIGLVLALGGLVAMFVSRPRPTDGPPPIADPYEELYSDLRGEVVARPVSEPHAGVNRQELGDNGSLTAASSDTDTAEFVPPPAGERDDGRETNRIDDDRPSWRDQAELEEPLWPKIAKLAVAKRDRHPPWDRGASTQPGQWLE